VISDEHRAIVERNWPHLVFKLPPNDDHETPRLIRVDWYCTRQKLMHGDGSSER
jgi:hypothetical protein